jgi:hypothetical protein
MKTSLCFCRSGFTALVIIAATLASVGTAHAKNDKENGKGNGNGNGKGANSPNFIPPGHRRAPVEVIVMQAPPALRVEVISARPSAAHVSVPGFWAWGGSVYVWTPSVWVLPPEPAAVWVAPRYEERSGVHVSISGFWKI